MASSIFKESLSSPPYVAKGHFEIGKNLHTDTFHYAKKWFQSSNNAKDAAQELAYDIAQKFSGLNNITLLGLSNFLSLFLNNAVNHLQGLGGKKLNINYATLDKSAEEFSFTYNRGLLEHIIVIMPITRTFERYIRIKDFVERQSSRCKVQTHFYSVFLVVDTDIQGKLENARENPLLIDDIEDMTIRKFYQTYRWQSVSNKTVQLDFHAPSQKKRIAYSASFFEACPAGLFLSERCPKCFPEIFLKDEPNQLYPEDQALVLTPTNHDTLLAISGLPIFSEKQANRTDSGMRFSEVFKKRVSKPIHLYGHIGIHGQSYLNYIQRDVFTKITR